MSDVHPPTELVAILPRLNPACMGLPELPGLWPDLCRSDRIRRMLAERLTAICDVTELRPDVAQLLSFSKDAMSHVQRLVGATLFAPALRRRIGRDQVEATRLMIGPDVFAFAIKNGVSEPDDRFSTVMVDDISAVGAALYQDWLTSFNDGERRLLETVHPMLRVAGLNKQDLANTAFPLAIGAARETL